jgi:hypothetical protein
MYCEAMSAGARLTRRAVLSMPVAAVAAANFKLRLEQITRGPQNHFFGYIGHVRNTPWNGGDRGMVVLATNAQDHMPRPDEAAEIVLLDARRGYKPTTLDRTFAWNPQQGTMLYWNPRKAASQLVFNDRDLKTNRVFAVLADVERRRRIQQFRYDDTPFGNSGVEQNGTRFLGINYGRMARLRPVTGYPEAYDWNPSAAAPANDGIFIADLETGSKKLLVSFEQLAAALPAYNGHRLFINHTLWNRDGNRIYFYLRGVMPGAESWDSDKNRLNAPCTIWPDGSNLTVHRQFIGGHPEWESQSRIIGAVENRQVIYDVDKQAIVGQLGTPELIPDPGGDGALSPDGKWFVSGYRVGRENRYALIRRSDGVGIQSQGIPIDNWTSGVLRLDPAPCWNRAGTAFAVPGIADDPQRTRQTFVFYIEAA